MGSTLKNRTVVVKVKNVPHEEQVILVVPAFCTSKLMMINSGATSRQLWQFRGEYRIAYESLHI